MMHTVQSQKGGQRHVLRVPHKDENKDQQNQLYCTDLIHPPKSVLYFKTDRHKT